MTVPSWPEVEEQCIEVLPGGQYKPEACVSDSNIAIIVPYRNRETQLRTFLRHIHPFLRNQFLHYRIFIIELVRACYVRYEPRCEKTGLRGLRPGPTQTGLCSHRRWLEAWNFGFRKKRNCSIYVAKTKALISCAVFFITRVIQ